MNNMENKKIAKFEKVSFDQFKEDYLNVIGITDADIDNYVLSFLKDIYDNIKLPSRSTSGSAGYDFYSPIAIKLACDESIIIPTGIRCYMEDGYVLNLYPRSGLGFKNKMMLYNTVGIIDSDYYNSDNEGHIMIKITHSNPNGLYIEKGKAFAQGIFTEFFITYDDASSQLRNGGFGSTDK